MAAQKVYVVVSRKNDSNKIIGIFSTLSEAENIFLKYPESDHFEIEELEIDSLVSESEQRINLFYWQYRIWVKLPFCTEVVASKQLRRIATIGIGEKSSYSVCKIDDQEGKTEIWFVCSYHVGSEGEARSIAVCKAKEFISLTSSGINEKDAIAQLNQ